MWTKEITFAPSNDWACTEPTDKEYFRLRSLNPPRAGKFLIAEVEFNEFNASLQNIQEVPATSDYLIVRMPKSPVMEGRRIGIIQVEDYRVKDWGVELWSSDYITPASGEVTPPETIINLPFTAPSDENGLFYVIGTQGGTQPWQNPLLAGYISATHLRRGGEDLYHPDHMFDRTNRSGDANFWFGGTAGDYFEVDFGEWRIKPNYYMIKAWHNDNRYPRNWTIALSEDGLAWDNLSIQTNEQTIQAPFGVGAFPITGATKYYKKMRYINNGPNNSGSLEINLSEIELWGAIKKIAAA